MTYLEFRRYGYVSRLSEIRNGGGPSQSTMSTQSGITAEDRAIAEQQNQFSLQDRARRDELSQPLIEKEKTLATGSPSAALAASMPTISKITAGFDAAKQSAFNALPPGPARDALMAKTAVDRATTTAGVQASMVQQAPEILANVGAGFGGTSLQEVGAGTIAVSCFYRRVGSRRRWHVVEGHQVAGVKYASMSYGQRYS